MVKVSELTKDRRSGRSPLQERVLRFLEAHPEEVFSYRDRDLARKLGVKESALSFTLWALERDGAIEKADIDKRTYFGSRTAVQALRERLGLHKPDPFDAARAFRDRIWARTGDIDVIELLDAVRGPWK
jgi:hypothetical protein